jgi:hypothetical protein
MPDNELYGSPSGEVYRQWAGLAKRATTFGVTAAGIPGGSAAVELISSLSGHGDAQAQLLASIKSDTKLLREEPFRTARTFLAEARRVGPQDPRYAQFIDEALKSFYKAHSLAQSAQELAVVEFDIAVIYLSIEKKNDAVYWFKKGQTSSRAAINNLVDGYILPIGPLGGRIYDKRPSARRNLVATLKRTSMEMVVGAAAGLAFPITFASMPSLYARWRKALGAARDFVSFTNLVESTAASVCNEEIVPPLGLFTEANRQVYLREMSAGGSSRTGR